MPGKQNQPTTVLKTLDLIGSNLSDSFNSSMAFLSNKRAMVERPVSTPPPRHTIRVLCFAPIRDQNDTHLGVHRARFLSAA
jgi:hypothetical protein